MKFLLAAIAAVPAATNAEADLSWVGPTAGIVGSIIVAAIGGAAAVWRRRQDRQDQMVDKQLDKQATEKDGWTEVRAARDEASRYYRLYRIFEELFYTVHAALRYLARKVHEQHPNQDLGDEVVKALALRPPEDLDRV